MYDTTSFWDNGNGDGNVTQAGCFAFASMRGLKTRKCCLKTSTHFERNYLLLRGSGLGSHTSCRDCSRSFHRAETPWQPQHRNNHCGGNNTAVISPRPTPWQPQDGNNHCGRDDSPVALQLVSFRMASLHHRLLCGYIEENRVAKN